MVDANQALRLDDAQRRVQLLSELDLAWIEEPFPADDISGSARIRRHFRATCSSAVCTMSSAWPRSPVSQVGGAQQSGRRLAHELVEVAAQRVDRHAR